MEGSRPYSPAVPLHQLHQTPIRTWRVTHSSHRGKKAAATTRVLLVAGTDCSRVIQSNLAQHHVSYVISPYGTQYASNLLGLRKKSASSPLEVELLASLLEEGVPLLLLLVLRLVDVLSTVKPAGVQEAASQGHYHSDDYHVT